MNGREARESGLRLKGAGCTGAVVLKFGTGGLAADRVPPVVASPLYLTLNLLTLLARALLGELD